MYLACGKEERINELVYRDKRKKAWPIVKRSIVILVIAAIILSVVVFDIAIHDRKNRMPILSVMLTRGYYFELDTECNLKVMLGYPEGLAKGFLRDISKKEELKLTKQQFNDILELAKGINDTIEPGSDYRIWGSDLIDAEILYKDNWYAFTYGLSPLLTKQIKENQEQRLQNIKKLNELIELLVQYSPMRIDGFKTGN